MDTAYRVAGNPISPDWKPACGSQTACRRDASDKPIHEPRRAMIHWRRIFHLAIGCLLLALPAAAGSTPAPKVDQWRLVAGQRSDASFRPTRGTHTAQAALPVTFDKQPPHALLFTGDVKGRHRVVVTNDFHTAQLPRRALTVEAWVRIDQTAEWGGLIGAIQDNGDYEKGWLLGFRKTQLFFALAGRDTPRLTFLMSDRSFETGYWYHVVGTYDGQQQRLYVDGQLAAAADQQRGDIDYPGQAAFVIGAYQDQDEFYPLKGSIEMASVRNRAQSAEWVRNQFERRKSLFPEIDAVHPQVTDWPTYLRDNQRTGLAQQSLRFPLTLQWRFRNPHPPRPAWPAPANQDFWHKKQRLRARVVFDRSNQVVSVGNRVFFGSSADDRVYCLNAETGSIEWTFITEGPVRLAPTVAQGRVLFGSDDGHVYCVDASHGGLHWKFRAAEADRRIAGNERIISAWPVRTGVLVEDNVAYFCAGLFPTQGVYQVAVDIATGQELGRGKLPAAAQGYLERRNGKLYVSTGRDPAGAFVASLKRRGKGVGKLVRSIPQQYRYAFVGAGETRFGGGDGKVAAFRARDGAEIWSAAVDGAAYSLAIAGNTLFVSTDTGDVYAFGPKSQAEQKTASAQPQPAGRVTPGPHVRPQVDQSAELLIQQSALRRGYCLVLNCGDAELIQALAQRTSWQIVGL
ncbi:MAG: LamG-like jellyroll fold domain-containing protein, partial [Planctomycetaceae bacterium]